MLFVIWLLLKGGDGDYILHPEKFPATKEVIEVLAPEDGYVKDLRSFASWSCVYETWWWT